MLLFYMTSVIENETDSQIDREILDRLIAGTANKNKEAFEELYNITSPSVYSYSLSVLKNKYDAEDVMHDCYINIYNSAESYVSKGKPMAWILTIAKNLCFLKLRKNQKASDISEEDVERKAFLDENLSAEDKFVIEKCMNCLSDTERQIIILHAVSGFKHREIAELLEIRLSTVLSKYNRAIKKLGELIEKEWI